MLTLVVIIGTYNRRAQLQKCLESIMGKVSHSCMIYVIDAGSSDGTIQYLEKLEKRKKIKFIRQKKKIGQIKSFNKILPKITSKYVCWLSDDNVVVDNMLDEAIGILDENNSIGMIGLKVKDMMGKLSQEPYIGSVWSSGVLNINQGIIRTDLFKKIGYFDDAFPDYGMDADLTTKVLLAGYKVVLTKKIAVLHFRDYGKNPGTNSEKERRKKILRAIEIYKIKYRTLCRNIRVSRRVYTSLLPVSAIFIRACCSIINLAGFIRNSGLRINQRDLRNIFESEYVSLNDLYLNRRKLYYLVQSINSPH